MAVSSPSLLPRIDCVTADFSAGVIDAHLALAAWTWAFIAAVVSGVSGFMFISL